MRIFAFGSGYKNVAVEILWLHSKMPAFLPEWIRWTLVAALVIGLFVVISKIYDLMKRFWQGRRGPKK